MDLTALRNIRQIVSGEKDENKNLSLLKSDFYSLNIIKM